jgi:hypothetical protein
VFINLTTGQTPNSFPSSMIEWLPKPAT